MHALAQVASVDVEGGPPAPRAAGALNALLPHDVAVLESDEAAPDFHARHSAQARSYRYRIFTRKTRSPFELNRSWWYPRAIDREALDRSTAALLGEHDFRAFTPSDTEHEVFRRNVLEARWVERDDELRFEITADSFLRHMVRTLVGTMLELPSERFVELLQGRPRAEAGTTAPPWGLYLTHVRY